MTLHLRAVLAATLAATCLITWIGGARADSPKCSAPDVLAAVQDRAREALEISYRFLPAANFNTLHELRFPSGPTLTFSEFVGTPAGEATRHCSAKLVLGSGAMAQVSGRVDYDASATEDGKLLIDLDDGNQAMLHQILRAYDDDNGLTEKVREQVLIGIGAGDLSGRPKGFSYQGVPPQPPKPVNERSFFGTSSDAPQPRASSRRLVGPR